ncbi:hypothetical protein BDV29DRAFT_167701 [Aspergillus leporis]|uniref:Uncharacterized protein n=1 Tax=Aspergillus leporis TaxID=41062 RepID=A0A5N5XEC6_9EURO|nr:hypothetical protein BDV29DRAFT_167701 [Aspergillus leporis]
MALQSVGLSPLLLSSLGLLKRVFDEIPQHMPSGPDSQHNVILQGLSSSSGIANKLKVDISNEEHKRE